MSIASKPGENLQRLVRLIEIGIAQNPNVAITSPARLRDLDTGRLREHDVLLTFTEKHHVLRIALECRDRSRKVGVPEVEAFLAKCQRTGIDQGIIVSSLGFTHTAQQKARASNLRCLTLAQAEQFSWIAMDSLTEISRMIVATNLVIGLEEGAAPDMSSPRVFLGDGTEMTRDAALRLATVGLNEVVPHPSEAIASPDIREHRFELQFEAGDPPYVLDASGLSYRILRGALVIQYKTMVRQHPMGFHRYGEAGSATEITQAASVTFPIGDRSGHLVAVSNDDGTTTIKVVVDGPEG